MLNAEIDRPALVHALEQQGAVLYRSLTEQHSHLFANVPVFISAAHFAQMEAVIAAVEAVVHSPAWSRALALTPAESGEAKGVFFGYDFHLNEQGAHLIEINTNAGGALLNQVLLQSQAGIALSGKTTAPENLEQHLVEMFRNEWRLVRGDLPLGVIAIVDERPQEQYLYPEFILAQQMFERAGLRALIADPAALEARVDGLYFNDQKIDLVYNRLTDFSLQSYPALFEAYRNKQVVVTPHPAVYTRYADKRNLAKLTDEDFLRTLPVSEDVIRVLQQGIPQTHVVSKEDAEQWWASRKQWFFKPVTGYGAKGAYRGEKITKRVFEDILAGDYVAQKLAPPGECVATVNGESATLKYDVRCYVYDGKIQLVAARLYQGQTTNFRTEGGGFGLVRVL
jgi:hypothetical protein